MTSAVSISEAARLTGKNRRTLHRHIEAGRLSVSHDATGAPQVEIVELLRVYGPLMNAPVSQPVADRGGEAVSQSASSMPHAMSQVSQGVVGEALELVTLRAEVGKLQALLEAKDHHIASLDRALLAIEHTTKTVTPPVATVTMPATNEKPHKPSKKNGFMRWFFGDD